jgi:hypothetical protein
MTENDGRTRHAQLRQLEALLAKARAERHQALLLIDDLLAAWPPESWDKPLRQRAIVFLAQARGFQDALDLAALDLGVSPDVIERMK